jgi:hypothetical protein
MAKKGNHMWTREEIRKVLKLWESRDTHQIAHELGVQPAQVSYIAGEIRKVNPKFCPKKNRAGYLRSLILDVTKE